MSDSNRTSYSKGPLCITALLAVTLILLNPGVGLSAQEWQQMQSGTTVTLWSVWGCSPSDVFAVGQNGTILHYDGSGWSPMDSGTTKTLNGLWGTSSSDVYAVGATNGRVILHFDGSSWQEMASPPTSFGYWNVWGSSSSDIFAVGSNGTIVHYDGTTWSAMFTPSFAAQVAVWGSSSSDVFSVYNDGFIWHYNGAYWSRMDIPSTCSLHGLWGSSGLDYFAVGCTVYHYDGMSWSQMDSGDHEWLFGVHGTSPSDVFAVGYYGTILHYDGASWTPMNTNMDAHLKDIWASESDVFAVGDGGTILHHERGSSPITLTLNLDPADSGTVSGPGIDCGSDCEETYDQGTEVTLTAVSDFDWTFEYWDDGLSCYYENPLIITMDADLALTAKFTPVCNSPAFVYADNSDAFGLFEGAVEYEISNEITTGTIDIQATDLIDMPFLKPKGVSFWVSIDDIVYDPSNITLEPNEEDVIGATFADLRLIAPGTHASYSASFCQPGVIKFDLGLSETAIKLTLADAIISIVPIVSKVAPYRVLPFADALNDIPLMASAYTHISNAINAGRDSKRRKAFRELRKAGTDLSKLALDREQRKQLVEAYADLGANVTIKELIKALWGAPVRVFKIFGDVIVLGIQTDWGTAGTIRISIVAS